MRNSESSSRVIALLARLLMAWVYPNFCCCSNVMVGVLPPSLICVVGLASSIKTFFFYEAFSLAEDDFLKDDCSGVKVREFYLL